MPDTLPKYLMAFMGVSIGLYLIGQWNQQMAYFMVIAILFVMWMRISDEQKASIFRLFGI